MPDFDLVKISDVADYRREFIEISDTEEYKRCRVQLHKKGVVLRDIIKGSDIKTKKQRLCKTNDFIVAEMDAKFGGYGIIPESLNNAIVSSHYYLFELDQNKILPEYLKVLIDTDVIQSQIKAKGTTNYSRVSPKEILNFEIPCPSIDVQKKIIRKYISSKKHVINILKESDTQQFFLKQLRQAILQEAVVGKLTAEWRKRHPEMISGENHAARLLEKIKAEKEALTKHTKGTKKIKELPPISDEEKPFELPEGWVWTRLQNLGIINPRNYISDEIEVSFSPMNLIPFKYGVNLKFVKKKWKHVKAGFTHYQNNDVLIAKITPSFENGKSVVACNLINGYGAGTTELHVFRGNPNFINPFYVLIYFKTPKFLIEGEMKMTGTAGQQRVPKSYISENHFPLPPFPEQQAIVDKVDRLLAKIDALEEQVKARKEQAEQLMQAVLREAFNGES